MSRVLVLAVLLTPFAVFSADPGRAPTDEAGFTRFAAERIRKEVGDTPVSIKAPLTLSVGPLQANLDRVFAFCRERSDACAAEVATYARGVVDALKNLDPPLDKRTVRLVIRDAESIKRAQGTFGQDAPRLLVQPLVETLMVVVVADTPKTMRFLDGRALGALKLSKSKLFALARQNVRAELRPLGEVAKPIQAGQIGSIGGSVYEVSRVALHDDWATLAQAQGGRLIVAMPTTDLVLYAADDTPVAIDAVRTYARQVMSRASNPLSSDVLKWTPKEWAPAR